MNRTNGWLESWCGRLQWSVIVIGTLVVMGGCQSEDTSPPPPDPADFPNLLNLRGAPAEPRDLSVFSFSDQGAWFSFGLPDYTTRETWGGFTGPLLLTHGGAWLGQSFARLRVEDASTGEAIDWSLSDSTALDYFPGRLHQSLSAESLEVELDLVFATNRTALLRVGVRNVGDLPRRLRIGWQGDVMLEEAEIIPRPNGVSVVFPIDSGMVDLVLDGSPAEVAFDSTTYRALGSQVELPAGGSETRYASVSVFADAVERGFSVVSADDALSDPETHFERNHDRWTGYLAGALDASDPQLLTDGTRSLAVKALETLITNWRSPYGDLHHNGLFPSYAYRGFHGVWSWDSWKHARALANFAPELAKDQLRVMFDYQDQYGMVPDVIYADSTENNWRDTKPPLSAWAVWAIYERTGDQGFLEEMYPKLWQFHEWWYANRDHDVNGLCEYGSTDGTRIAAGWESGMDNAVRFDEATMLQNNPRAWSLNQESVDLNSYLYAEKLYLASMADELARDRDVALLRAAAEDLRGLIQSTMFDEETGYFYDVDIETKEPLPVQGPEGWIPLWAGVANETQARQVVRVMMDPEKFATLVPFPTLAADHEKFDPRDGYWRGSVWLDQAYFAVKGLERYGYSSEADAMRARLFENPEGLLADAPIFENYHPQTGEPLNASHFSWSAAHYLLLLEANTGEER